MKKLIFSLGIIIAFTFYVLLSNPDSTSYSYVIPSQTASSSGDGSSGRVSTTSGSSSTPKSSGKVNPPTSTPKPTPTPTPIVAQTGTYKDGTYTGNVYSAFYGNVQVTAVVQNGQLSDVQFLQYPSDNGHSLEVSNFSLPTLKQEAIQSQSANVDIVSGATATSGAFQQSLASALVQAKI